MLNVWNNQIGNEGAKALAANTTLTKLDVRNNEIDTANEKVIEMRLLNKLAFFLMLF